MVRKPKKIGMQTSIRNTMIYKLVDNKNFSSQSLGNGARLPIKGIVM